MERRAIAVQGIVQGVGFRPFVYGLASRLELSGFVKNRVGGVLIEVEGDVRSLDQFLTELATRPPPLARIDHLSWERRPTRGDCQFHIQPSEVESPGPIFVSPDVATCADCLAELLAPSDRRHRYPFLNCTNCGPRLTIVTGAPYDRQRTTMAGFPMCAACRAEYENPTDRRFHAQPTCCPVCGPRLQVVDRVGRPIPSSDPLVYFAAALRAGQIGALKGLGGYHLACNARSGAAVAELRRRKHRDEKPFALMVADAAAAEALCEVKPAERELLQSVRRPIVLLRKRDNAVVAEEVAPRNPYLGVMLPYTPLHHLLLRAVEGTPLVMTSGNRSDEPIAYEDADALRRLADIADLFLLHDRPIHVRCDDSVTRVVDGGEVPLRRSRGYAPQSIPLPLECPLPILAVGGQLKGTFALGRGRHAFLSHHLGDLDHYDAYRAFVKDIALYEQLFAIEPRVVAHDLHPDYASTRYARQRAKNPKSQLPNPKQIQMTEGENPKPEESLVSDFGTLDFGFVWDLGAGIWDLQILAVQHHHAHMASCMAEHGLLEPVIGVSFDGTGYGTDGAIWGGEFLVGDYRQFRRAAHLRYVGMPGGDQAIREPWRMALAHLLDASGTDDLLASHVPTVALRTARTMIERQFNTPLTSSAGRLFDAVASLAGVRDRVTFEGQAAVELEWLAAEAATDNAYPFDLVQMGPEATLAIDTRPIIQAVARDARQRTDTRRIARRFHSTMVELIATVCDRLRQATGLKVVVLSGGVFMNALLTQEASGRLQREGFQVYCHRLVPPNDGGLSLGQLAIAAHQTSQG
jgi:hydrogenase maturation protein HypF